MDDLLTGVADAHIDQSHPALKARYADPYGHDAYLQGRYANARPGQAPGRKGKKPAKPSTQNGAARRWVEDNGKPRLHEHIRRYKNHHPQQHDGVEIHPTSPHEAPTSGDTAEMVRRWMPDIIARAIATTTKASAKKPGPQQSASRLAQAGKSDTSKGNKMVKTGKADDAKGTKSGAAGQTSLEAGAALMRTGQADMASGKTKAGEADLVKGMKDDKTGAAEMAESKKEKAAGQKDIATGDNEKIGMEDSKKGAAKPSSPTSKKPPKFRAVKRWAYADAEAEAEAEAEAFMDEYPELFARDLDFEERNAEPVSNFEERDLGLEERDAELETPFDFEERDLIFEERDFEPFWSLY
ncbi:hypothetical protein MMC19_005388 [Ptychographa xylographoides]|nr:hypothetical protein [Ptychographa xylographoides]